MMIIIFLDEGVRRSDNGCRIWSVVVLVFNIEVRDVGSF